MTEKTSPFLEMNAAPLPPRRKRARMIGALIAVVMLMVVSAAVWYRVMWNDLIHAAVIDGVRTAVVAGSDGQVSAVQAQEGQIVAQGEPLIVLRPVLGSGGEADVRAALDQLHGQLRTGEEAERRAQEVVEQASLAHAQAQLSVRGAGQPVPGSQASAQDAQHRSEELRKAKTGLDNARARLESASTARQATERAYRQIRDALMLVESKRREAGQAQAEPEQAVLTAPAAGRVGALGVEPGMTVSRGQTLAVIESVVPEQMWITGYVAPTRLTDLRPGQVFAVKIAEQPDAQLTAQIEAILPTQPGDSAAGVPVRLRLMGYDPLQMSALVQGQAVEVRLP